ncbi:class I SAM-dependent methyltransferase [Sphingoaurantiacus capsulatus]|uniref:Class I SAM-dependent methyltransferase n=1 Tax=Sphingoaurantiacus capsulatus TaxID=1771310 RepID=A0ABV7X8R0_9SPHN
MKTLVRVTLLAAAAALSVGAVAQTAKPAAAKHDHNAMLLDQAIAGAHRSAANKARDPYRHPKETLAFFGIKPNMTVVEIAPGGGWYTEILGPYLANGGTLYAAAANPAASERAAKSVADFKTKLAATPGTAKVQVTSFAKDHYANLAPAGSADAVLTFRNVHNWYSGGFAPDAFKAFYAALKPGGTLGVVEHRLPEARPDEQQKTSGYMKRSEVVKLAEAAGFKLAGESEVNANPKDTADYPDGVWTLPPNYRLGDVDRAKYAAIGESDRMTLKFVKPAR